MLLPLHKELLQAACQRRADYLTVFFRIFRQLSGQSPLSDLFFSVGHPLAMDWWLRSGLSRLKT